MHVCVAVIPSKVLGSLIISVACMSDVYMTHHKVQETLPIRVVEKLLFLLN